ncbi:MAG: dethiobiotin synthase [Bacteroidales bacterium]
MKHKTYFVSGIDTNIGKTVVTGILAKEMQEAGIRVITQKMIQTGNIGFSEDIEQHRRIMGIPLSSEDKNLLTAPCIRSYPCSPHLAATIDKQPIDIESIYQATLELEKEYDVVLLEGAGGLMVPITKDYLTIDYICEHNYPVILVTSGKLGSLNHTLLSLEALKQKGICLEKLIYNLYPKADPVIEADSLEYLQYVLRRDFPGAKIEQIQEVII